MNVDINSLKQERDELLNEIAGLSKLLHGSWVERYSTCSNKKCKCHKGEKHGPRRYLVVNENGRQKQKYIANRLVEEAKVGIQQHHRLKEIVDRMTEINLILMKEIN
jgi:hypothetical protein